MARDLAITGGRAEVVDARIPSRYGGGVKRCLLVLFVASGCQSDDKPAKPAAAAASDDKTYAADIGRLCDSMSLSGADKMAKLERVAPHSKWLGENLETKAAQEFLIKTAPLKGAARADAYDAEAKRVGLAGCALAAEFR
jgi:hypothetical protein